MTDPISFLKTIYYGDEACKSLIIDGWASEVKLQLTSISRVRSETWNYYTPEDIEDGYLVFGGVRSIAFEPSGVIPNDLINEICITQSEQDSSAYDVLISISSVSSAGDYTEVEVRMVATSLALEDPAKPGVRIAT